MAFEKAEKRAQEIYKVGQTNLFVTVLAFSFYGPSTSETDIAILKWNIFKKRNKTFSIFSVHIVQRKHISDTCYSGGLGLN